MFRSGASQPSELTAQRSCRSVLQKMIAAFLAIASEGFVLLSSTYAESLCVGFVFLTCPCCRANNNDTSHRFRWRQVPRSIFVSDGGFNHRSFGQTFGRENGCAVCLPQTFDILRCSGSRLPHRALSAYRFAAALVLNRTHSCRDYAFGDVATII